MITFDDTRFVAVSSNREGLVFSPVKGRGGAHVLTLPVAAAPGVDALTHADSDGRMVTVCGKTLKASNLVSGVQRTVCAECAAWLASDAHTSEVSRTLDVWESANAPKVTVKEDTPKVMESDTADSAPVACPGKGHAPVAGTRVKDGKRTMGTCPKCGQVVPVNAVANGKVRAHTRKVAAPVAVCTSHPKRERAIEHERARRRDVKIRREAASEREARIVAGITDGKCAYEVRDDSGQLTLKIVHGRSKMAPVAGSESVNASGQDTGTCPVCRTHVVLTGSGCVPTHRPGNVTPDGPVLSQKTVPAVDRGTPVADMAKVQDSQAYKATDTDGNELSDTEVRDAEKNGETVVVTPVVDTAPDAGAAVGNRDHGRLDGVAMTAGDLPPVQPTRGYAAAAGTNALPVGRPRPDAQVIKDVMHGGKFGYLTRADYDLLSRTQQRAYWRNVRTMEARAKRARAMVAAQREALGQQLPAKVRKAARRDASIGSAVSGTVAGRVHH